MTIQRKGLTGLAALLTCASTALAWNSHGHELAAYIAYQDLRPEQRALFNGWLRQHPEHDRLVQGCPAGFDQDLYVFMRASTWPDMVRDSKEPYHGSENHPSWHSVRFPINLGSAHGPTPEPTPGAVRDPKNILQALAKCEADLADSGLSDRDRAVRLSWLLHLVGDIHQPMHASDLYSDQFPRGDDGGNLFWVTAHGKAVRLNTYWEDLLGDSTDAKRIAAQADALRRKPTLTRDRFSGQLSHTGPDAWALESLAIATKDGYLDGQLKGARGKGENKAPPDSPPALSGEYGERAVLVAQEQIVLAGYRLADTLASVAERSPHQ